MDIIEPVSIKICELCNIKPLVGCRNYELICNKYNVCNSKCRYYEEIYPDFKNNNKNFVRLLRIIHQFDLLISNNECSKDEDIIEYILNTLLKYLSIKRDDNVEELKRIIRCMNWEYKRGYIIKKG